MTVDISKNLIDALEAEEPGALGKIVAKKRPRDVEALQHIARNDDRSFTVSKQRKALAAIGRLGDPSAVPMLVEVLPRLDDDQARIAAIDALGRLGSQAAVDAFADYVDDDSPQVRKTVVNALGRCRTPQAQELLAELAAGSRGDARTQERARAILDRSR